MIDATEISGWTGQRVELLKTLWARGNTALEIAKELGGGLSRCAVLGRARRMKLPNRPLGRKPSARLKPEQPGSRRAAVKTALIAAAPVPASPPPSMPPPAPPRAPVEQIDTKTCFEAGERPVVELKDLRSGMCRWPYGDRPPFRYCGARVEDPSNPLCSYCASHAALAYDRRPRAARKRAA